ncbi:MAG: hypothetical protein WD398_03510 [Cyclobacteriaceae bacterium]
MPTKGGYREAPVKTGGNSLKNNLPSYAGTGYAAEGAGGFN